MSADEAGRLLAKAERLGVLVPAGDGRFRAPSLSLLAVAEEVVARGISLEGALEVFAEIEAALGELARRLSERTS